MAKDIEALEAGYPGVQLPATTAGNALVCLDQSRPFSTMPSSNQAKSDRDMRCTMYLLTRAALDATAPGIVVLRLVRHSDLDCRSLQMLAALTECFPARIPFIHFCCLPLECGSRSHLVGTSHSIRVYGERLVTMFGQKAIVHVAENQADILANLVSCGFKKSGLPLALGGSWSAESVNSWLHRKQTPGAALHSDRIPAVSSNSNNSSKSDPSHKTRIDDRISRRRLMDALYARKRRQDEKHKLKTIEQQVLDLKKANAELEVTNQELETMLTDAKSKISLIEYGMSIVESKQTKQNHKRKSNLTLEIPSQSVKKSRLNANSFTGESHLDKSCITVGTIGDSTTVEQAEAARVALLHALHQQERLMQQRDSRILHILAAKQARDRQLASDLQSPLQRLTTNQILPPSSLADNFYQSQLQLMAQLNNILGTPHQQSNDDPGLSQNPHNSALAAQARLDQLLDANLAQPNGLLISQATTASQRTSNHQGSGVLDARDVILQQMLREPLASPSSLSAFARNFMTNQMQDFLDTFFRM